MIITVVLFEFVQETDGMEMSRCGDRKGHDIAHGLVKGWVSSTAELNVLVFILHVVLDVS